MDEVYPDGELYLQSQCKKSKKKLSHDLHGTQCRSWREDSGCVSGNKGRRTSIRRSLLNVEIREQIYIYSKIIPGPGGMPVGTNGKAMLLLIRRNRQPGCRLHDRKTRRED